MAKKVLVGLSGGVDSSVSAALLKEQGYDVTGVFIKVWQPDFMPCSWPEERRSAMAAAATLGIPFETLDLSGEYKMHVVDYMIREYKAGRTPNPDVMCNQHVKFGAFLTHAHAKGSDFVATGHYAQHIYNKELGRHELHEGVDANKDQSYFLWTLMYNRLPHVLFPVGGMQKSEVRALATKFGLHTAEKKDSQGLCFIGKLDMKDFLKHYIPSQEGDVLNEKGTVIGTHEGATFYTIGQRQGFTIRTKDTNRKPYYIVAKDIKKNTITVSNTPHTHSDNPRSIWLSSDNWLSGETPEEGNYEARIRYRGNRERCFVREKQGKVQVLFKDRQQGLSAGQSLVLYENTQCLGGGIMETD